MRRPAIAGGSHELYEAMGSQSQLDAQMEKINFKQEHTVLGNLAVQEASRD